MTHQRVNILYSGVDRVDNNQGYVLRNCVPCCKWCNLAKNNTDVHSFLHAIKRIVECQKK